MSDLDFTTRFPEGVVADERPGFSGYIVEADKLVKFAAVLRDEFGYDYLSSVTGVDYPADEKLEVVYHAYKTTGGPGAVNYWPDPPGGPVVTDLTVSPSSVPQGGTVTITVTGEVR